MPKTQVDIFELLQKYLTSIGIPKQIVETTTLQDRFEQYIYHKIQKKSNIIIANKLGLGSNETHIYITKDSRNMMFTDADIMAYEADDNTRESSQQVAMFEANIASLLERRGKKLLTDPLLRDYKFEETYDVTSHRLLVGNSTKWIDTNKGETQIRLGKKEHDSDSFNDFRLGILLDDYLVLLKHKLSDTILAICIPSECVSRYDVKSPVKPNRSHEKENQIVEQQADSAYITATTDSGDDELSPGMPQPAPKPQSTPSAVKYIAKPSIGRGALRKAAFICANESTHETFIARSSGHPYMEPHHLIPLSSQYLFESDIDITSNIICLCPTCHSKIHYGTREEIQTLICKFWNERRAELATCGIQIEFETLCALYKI